MGIKHYWKWFREHFHASILRKKKTEKFEKTVDNLLIDMNGIFHNSAQKIFRYGSHKPVQRLLGADRPPRLPYRETQQKVFEHVCETIDELVRYVQPRKRLVLCVDGPAPIAKQCQQRSRRFMSALEASTGPRPPFDSNSITPGTKFMDFLGKYIDWYIKKRMSEQGSLWGKLEVIFSNEKVAGEGEYKIFHYIRNSPTKDQETYCIHGMDADLIMLALSTQLSNLYILRDDPTESEYDYYLIDIGSVRVDMLKVLYWGEGFKANSGINDFVVMCFAVGNDFLPHIPGIEIIEGGIDFMIDVYKNIGKSYGHITKPCATGVRLRRRALEPFLGTLAQYEKLVFEQKLSHADEFFPDPMLNMCENPETREFDIEKYREMYYAEKFGNFRDIEQMVCLTYLEGMQWVLNYYTHGVPDWKWYYPYHYAPFAHTLATYAGCLEFSEYKESSPTMPFVQLLSVLPGSSSRLLPAPLCDLFEKQLKKFCPTDFKVDLAGKRQRWEGTVILPFIDYGFVEKLYLDLLEQIDEKEQRRNMLGNTFLYTPGRMRYVFKSFYGDLDCKVNVQKFSI